MGQNENAGTEWEGPEGWGSRGKVPKGWGPKRVGFKPRRSWGPNGEGRRVGAKTSRFFSLPIFFVFFLLPFPKVFVELRWSLRVFITENVYTAHKCGVLWTICDAPAKNTSKQMRKKFFFFF